MKPISIKTIEHKHQRYPTVGDWYDLDSVSIVKVSDMGDSDMEFCVAIHEAVEQYLCNKRGISDEVVTEFDKDNLDHENPGDLFNSPYHKEHMVASVVEMLLIKELGIDMEKYEETMIKLYE